MKETYRETQTRVRGDDGMEKGKRRSDKRGSKKLKEGDESEGETGRKSDGDGVISVEGDRNWRKGKKE